VPSALVLDDDPEVLRPLAALIAHEGFEVRTCGSLAGARAELAAGGFDVVVADLQLPDGQALELLPLLEERPATEMIVVTGHGSVGSAVEAFRGGAIDYLIKPVDPHHLRQLLRRIATALALRGEVDILRSELRRAGRFGKMIGASPAMQRLYDQVLRVARTNATVLIHGETGTGKELVAETIHAMSPRARQPFVAVNCGAMPATLIASELFGHEKGSFTGATQRRLGVFERASGGTLFLDEITEMPPDLQVILLRVVETRTVKRVGGEGEFPVDVRVIAATNRDPEKSVRSGRLREDLFFRLAVFPIEVPPLRDRGDDIARIAEHTLAQLNEGAGTSKRLTPAAIAQLGSLAWPGNVRELRSCIERAFILSGDRIGLENLPGASGSAAAKERAGAWSAVGMTLAEAERELILATVRQLHDKSEASQALGISLKTLYNRLHKYGAMD
jgi:DNA-binding NtrC family response regulator